MFWKQTSQGPHAGRLRAGGASALFAGDVASLPRDVIHSVTNPLGRFTAGLHIYGGDFFETERSLWNAETLAEEPSNGERVRAMFAAENAKLKR
jgi:predicted metal-dependent enzyme (double-stranded beta helix superfamily)